MAKRTKKVRQEPNFICFLVEGKSDQIALELPLSNLILEKYPNCEIRFLQQEKRVRQTDSGYEDADCNEDEADPDDSYEDEDCRDDDEDEYLPEIEYRYGGDITSDHNVEPHNIETKITNRFIKPLIRRDGVYPKKIARIIHIIDLDGAYIPDENVVEYSPEHLGMTDPYYDAEAGRIEAGNVQSIVERNARKRRNIACLLSLQDQKIRIGSKKIPYEMYFFSSNLEHFTENNANVSDSKNFLADRFLRKYGIDEEIFCRYFSEDPDAIGHLGYHESWERVQQGTESIKRLTNIDCLIRKLAGD